MSDPKLDKDQQIKHLTEIAEDAIVEIKHLEKDIEELSINNAITQKNVLDPTMH